MPSLNLLNYSDILVFFKILEYQNVFCKNAVCGLEGQK